MRQRNHRVSVGALAVAMTLVGAGVAGAATSAGPDATTAVAAPASDAAAAPIFTVTVPSLSSENASMSDEALKAVMSGDIVPYAKQLGSLTATSIRVPDLKLTLSFSPKGAGGTTRTVYDYKDIDIENVKAGLAESISIGSVDATTTGNKVAGIFDSKFGKMTGTGFDIAGSLAFYGLLPGSPDQAPKPLYTGLKFAGGSLTSRSADCTIGPVAIGAFSARPLRTPFSDLLSLLGSKNFRAADPSPEVISKLVLFYADLISAVRSEPLTVTSLACTGSDDAGKPVAFKMGPLTVGGFGDERYPAIEAKNFSITGSDGSVSLDSLTSKSIDFSGPIKLIEHAAAPLTKQWLTANARKLIPAFSGFAFSGLKLDVPDDETPGERIKATMADFDLGLSNYLDGVPMSISSVGHHLAILIPPAIAGKTDSYDELRQLGVSTLDLGYDLMLHRDAASNTVVVDKLGLNGTGLGSVGVSGVIGNASEALFSGDSAATEAAALALTLKSLKIDATDTGLGDIILKQAGSEQGTDLASMRSNMSSMAQGLVLIGLSGNPAAKALGDAVGKFVAGTAKSISVSVTPKDAAGLSVVDFAAAQNNPAALAGKVDIQATAQ